VSDDDQAQLPALADGGDGGDQLVADLRRIIEAGRVRVATAVNTSIVATYREIGERIVREEQDGQVRAGYGDHLLRRLGRVLSRVFGRGFAEQSLRAMRQVFVMYPIRSALRSELTWTHYHPLPHPDASLRGAARLLRAPGGDGAVEFARTGQADQPAR